MGVYRMKIAGRNKPLLVRAESLAKAKDAIASGEQLKAEEMETALLAGDKVWSPGDPMPADEEAKEPAGDGAAAEDGAK